jgi:basic membrane protein A
MQSTLKSRLAAATLTLGLGCPLAAFSAPGIVYDIGGKFDKSYNEAAWRGMSKWKQETGASFLEFEISSETQREQSMRRMAEHGTSPIIAVGFAQAAALQKVAADFPKLQFTLIDSIVNLPNVESVVFKEHEGTFLVGMLAALASKTG